MQRGTLAHYLKKEKEMTIAQDILQGLAKEDLTIGQAKRVLELVQLVINDAKFNYQPVSNMLGDSDKDNLIQCCKCGTAFIPEGNLCIICGAEITKDD